MTLGKDYEDFFSAALENPQVREEYILSLKAELERKQEALTSAYSMISRLEEDNEVRELMIEKLNDLVSRMRHELARVPRITEKEYKDSIIEGCEQI